MFGFGKDKKKKGKKDAKPSREELQKQAIANMRKARAEIGDENIQRMAAALKRMENPQEPQTEGGRAREKIKKMDSDRVADELKWMLEDDKKG